MGCGRNESIVARIRLQPSWIACNSLQFTGCCNPSIRKGVSRKFPISNAWFERSAQWCWLPYLSLHAPLAVKRGWADCGWGCSSFTANVQLPLCPRSQPAEICPWKLCLVSWCQLISHLGKGQIWMVCTKGAGPSIFCCACHPHWQESERSGQSPPTSESVTLCPPHWGWEVTTLWRASTHTHTDIYIYIYILYACFFFSSKHATCMSLSGTGSSDDCSLTFLAYNSTYGLGYIQAWFRFYLGLV